MEYILKAENFSLNAYNGRQQKDLGILNHKAYIILVSFPHFSETDEE